MVWKRDLEREVIVYSACRDIEAGEELCISYGDRLWFRDVEGEDDEERMNEEREGDELGRSGLGAIELLDGNENESGKRDKAERLRDVNGSTSSIYR